MSIPYLQIIPISLTCGDDRLAGPGGDILRGEEDDDPIRETAGDDQIHRQRHPLWRRRQRPHRQPRIRVRTRAHDLIFGGGGRDRAQFDVRDEFKAVEERTDAFDP